MRVAAKTTAAINMLIKFAYCLTESTAIAQPALGSWLPEFFEALELEVSLELPAWASGGYPGRTPRCSQMWCVRARLGLSSYIILYDIKLLRSY